MSFIIGGHGGGGDIGLASIIVEANSLEDSVLSVISFNKCSVEKLRKKGKVIAGSLIEINARLDLGRRFFEDKLLRLTGWSIKGYIICTRDSWRKIETGLKWIARNITPSCWLSTDLGGDSILLGYESRLGSYITDTVATASLYWLSSQYGIRTILAIGSIGAEGGGSELNLEEIVSTLIYLMERETILGIWIPRIEHTTIAWGLLSMAESGMLPMFLHSVAGRSRVRIKQAGLNGTYNIKPWYKYVFFLDPSKLCELSPLCREVLGKGHTSIKQWVTPKPPAEYVKIRQTIRNYTKKKGMIGLEKLFMSIIEDYRKKSRWHVMDCVV